MKRLLFALCLLFPLGARADVSCSIPFTLTNGTIADATQVMANYNALVACLLNAAEKGANTSITSLLGLTTPIPASGGGAQVYTGGTSSGTNAIVVSTTVPTSFTLTANRKVVFVAGGSNTAASTLNVAGTGVTNLFRPTPSGAAAMVGGEIVSGQVVEAVYDGTQYQMISRPALDMPPGMVFDYAGAAGCPVGSLLTNGATTDLTATFPTLSAVLGTTWGNPGGGAFARPDLRGRSTFSADSGGSSRITVAGGNIDGTVVGGTGGQQNKVVNQTNLAAFSLSVTDPGHVHIAGSSLNFLEAGGGVAAGTLGAASNVSLAPNTASATTGITVASGGSSTPLPTLSNAAIVLKCIKA